MEPERAAEPPAAAESVEPPAPRTERACGGPRAPPAAPEPAPEPVAPPPASGVDEDALAWARQAYARLKAQQEESLEAAAVEPPAAAPLRNPLLNPHPLLSPPRSRNPPLLSPRSRPLVSPSWSRPRPCGSSASRS